jgi:hypothetical protein
MSKIYSAKISAWHITKNKNFNVLGLSSLFEPLTACDCFIIVVIFFRMIFVGVGPLLVVSVLNYKIHRAVRQDEMVLLHNGGFWNNCTPKRCLHI